MKGTVFQPSVLQLNINRLPHSKYPDRKKSGNVPAWDSNPRPSACKVDAQIIGHQPPQIYRSGTDVFMDKVGRSWGTLQTPQYT